MFAALVREGSWVDARIDRAQPDRKPLPRPDLRRMLLPLGPVAVFPASNFPLAFSVAGGDTASAFAAGCPVIVKARPSHPGTSELVAQAVQKALAAADMPDGWFSMLHGAGRDLGLHLVKHTAIRAVGFTGSLQGGRALMDAAAARPDPIPVYAEMGSINPVFLLPGAIAQRGGQIAAGLHQSLTLGVGQFCTNPGLVIAIDAPPLQPLLSALADLVCATAPGTMLMAAIREDTKKVSSDWRRRPAWNASAVPPRPPIAAKPSAAQHCLPPTRQRFSIIPDCTKRSSGRQRCWCAAATNAKCWPLRAVWADN